MKTLLKSILFSGILYILPICFSSNFNVLLFDIRIWTTFFFSVILLTHQGSVNLGSTIKNAKTDKYSTLLIFFFGILSQVFAVVEWTFTFESNRIYANIYTIIGLLFLFLGTVIRVDALYKLNKNFSANIAEIKSGELVTDGIFSVVRHPSYLGAYITMLGTSLFFEAIYTFAFSTVLLVFVYAYRIYYEEKQLIKFYKNKYVKYMRQTWKMFPYIW